jgi:hypothetical protein
MIPSGIEPATFRLVALCILNIKYPKLDITLDKLIQNQIMTPDTPLFICPKIISKTDRDLYNDHFPLPENKLELKF